MSKKLLLLGGSVYLLPVIRAAHDLGLYVITCDNLPNNIAHPYADEYHPVSIVEMDEILQLAQSLRIDGIMSFATDPGVVTAAYVAEIMGLPYAGSYEAVSILQNKGRFRAFLEQHGFRTPRARSYTGIRAALSELDGFRFPLIVKPTDSAGSKGVSRADRPEELEDCIQKAIAFSRRKEFILEEYIEASGFASDSDCFSVDGRLCFTSFSDQHFDPKADNPFTPSGYTWPCTMDGEKQEELRGELQRLIRLLNLGTSLYNVETRIGTDGTPYIMEMSPRGGGNCISEVLRAATGTDMISAAVRAAVGLPVEIAQTPYQDYWGEMILHANQSGIYQGITVAEQVRDKLVRLDSWEEPGAKVSAFSGANKAVGTALFRFESRRELDDLMAEPDRYLKVCVHSEQD